MVFAENDIIIIIHFVFSQCKINSDHHMHCGTIMETIGPVSGSRYMARLRATGADLGTDHKNNIRWMTGVTSD